jgi:hypothetical protein
VGRTLLSAAFDLDFGYAKQFETFILVIQNKFETLATSNHTANKKQLQKRRTRVSAPHKKQCAGSAGALKLLNLLT